eukprot:NODE_927_length_3038_cov_0.223810.p3 type:complete len:123 gc:universal NODE_927_length_3038_cov_0.223810:2583-2951(+)
MFVFAILLFADLCEMKCYYRNEFIKRNLVGDKEKPKNLKMDFPELNIDKQVTPTRSNHHMLFQRLFINLEGGKWVLESGYSNNYHDFIQQLETQIDVDFTKSSQFIIGDWKCDYLFIDMKNH